MPLLSPTEQANVLKPIVLQWLEEVAFPDSGGEGTSHSAVTLSTAANVLLSLSDQDIGLDTQLANRAFIGPVSGAAAAPAFRLLISDDLPAHDILSKHSYSGGGALDVFGLSAAGTLAKLTPSYNPGAAAALLRTGDTGLLQLAGLGVGTAGAASQIIARGTAAAQLQLEYDAGNYARFTVGSGGNLTLAPTGDLELDPVGNDVLPAVGYDLNIGSLAKKYLTLHCAELWVETLVAQNTIATIGGRILVGPTTVLTSDMDTTQTSMFTKHNQMAINDIAYMEADGKVEFMRVTGGPVGGGPYGYTVVRNLDGSGGNLWYAGDAVFNTGTTGDGFMDLYSISAVSGPTKYGPTILGNARNSVTYNDWTEHWAIGNLNGVYGYGVDTYGVAVGKYSTTTSWLSADATNGIRIMRGSTQLAKWDVDGNILIGQAAAGQDNIYISAGALSVRNNATERIGLSAAGILTVKDSGGAAVFTFDASAGAEFTKPLTLGTAGGIFQGTGTFASPTTGLKMWNDGGVGRIAGYNAGVLQWYGNTDGKLYWAAGKGCLSATGIDVAISTSYADDRAYNFSSGGTIYSQLRGYTNAGHNYLGLIAVPGTENTYIDIAASAYTGKMGRIRLSAYDPAGDVYADLIYSATAKTFSLGSAGGGNVFLVTNIDTASADARISGGLYVGSVVIDPADNEIWTDGSVFLGGVHTNAFMTLGLTINQGTATNEAWALKMSTVAHGMTSITETDTYGLAKALATTGGVSWRGYTGATRAFQLLGAGVTDDTAKTTAAAGYVELAACKKSGTSFGSAGADANLVIIRNYSTTRFIFDAEGSAHADVEFVTFDEYDDVALLGEFERAMLANRDPVKRQFGIWLEENGALLERLGLVHFDRENPGHAMVNTTRMMMLLVGAVQQLSRRITL